MAIGLMICNARSGGTILNQCLGSMKDVIMLSEVNPLGGGWGKKLEKSYTTPYEQAKYWYGIELSNQNYLESILELEEFCKNNDKHLIIRDWSFINFSSVPYYNVYSPPMKFLNLDMLSKYTKVKTFAFVRDAIDVWISRGKPNIDQFGKEYFCFVSQFLKHNIPFFKYENFCKKSDSELEKICDSIKVPFDPSFIKKYNTFSNINGDIQLKKVSRGKENGNIIAPLKRKHLPLSEIIKLAGNQNLIDANKFLNYPKYYFKNFHIDFVNYFM